MVLKLIIKTCVICKATNKRIVLHHISYKKNIIIPVCDKCHKAIHKTNKYKDFKCKDKKHSFNMLIAVSDKTARQLKSLKIADNETYDSIIKRLIKSNKMVSKEK